MSSKSSTILIVDDDRLIRNLLVSSLVQSGFNVLQAQNGREALAEVRKKTDLILLDINMPDLSGFEIARMLKRDEAFLDIPIIMLTSESDSASLKAAFDAGAMDYIVKPPKKSELLARIDNALALKHERDTRRRREQELEKLSGKLAKYLSPQVYNSIFTGNRDVRIETARKKLTLFVSEIVDFPKMTENLDSEDLTCLLNEYFTAMAQIALAHGGTIDKLIGDAIVIFFGDPESKGDKEDAADCLRMALEMRKRAAYLRQKLYHTGITPPLHIRIGINTGYCMVGNFGTAQRLEYTAVGKQIHITRTLAALADPDQILVTDACFHLVKDVIACNRLHDKTLGQDAGAIDIYEATGVFKATGHPKAVIEEAFEGFSLKMDLGALNHRRALLVLDDAMQTLREDLKKEKS